MLAKAELVWTRRRRSRSSPGRRAVPREVVEPGRSHQVLRAGPRDRLAQHRGDHAPQGHVREAARLGEAGRRHARARSSCSTSSTGPLRYARDGGARDRAPAQARGLHRALAGGARATTENPEALEALAVSTSARASGGRSPRCSSGRRARSAVENELVAAAAQARRALRRQAQRRPRRGPRVQALARRSIPTTAARRSSSRSATSRWRWDDLEAFYATTDKWDELIRMLEREGDDANGADRRAHLAVQRVARLWDEKKDKADRAARAYEKVLELDADNLDAAVALSPIYERQATPKKLAGVYEVRLEHVADPEERMMLLREAGLLYEEKLKDPQHAFEVPRGVLARADARGHARGRRAAGRPSRGRLGQADRGLREGDRRRRPIRRDHRPAPERRLPCSRRSAASTTRSSSRARLRRRADNMRAAGARAALPPDRALRGPARDLRSARSSRTTREVRSSSRTTSPRSSRTSSRSRRGDRRYTQIIAECGDDEVDAYRALERLYEQELGSFADLADDARASHRPRTEPDEELAALKFRLARVQAAAPRGHGRGLELYREVLTLMPEHDGARVALESLLDDASSARPRPDPRADLRGRGRLGHLVRALEVLVRGRRGARGEARVCSPRSARSRRSARQRRRGVRRVLRALREVPEHDETLARLEGSRWSRTASPSSCKLVAELAAQRERPGALSPLCTQGCRARRTQLGNVDGAVGATARCSIDPATPRSSTRSRALPRTERWSELLGVLRRKVELTSGPEPQGAAARADGGDPPREAR